MPNTPGWFVWSRMRACVLNQPWHAGDTSKTTQKISILEKDKAPSARGQQNAAFPSFYRSSPPARACPPPAFPPQQRRGNAHLKDRETLPFALLQLEAAQVRPRAVDMRDSEGVLWPGGGGGTAHGEDSSRTGRRVALAGEGKGLLRCSCACI